MSKSTIPAEVYLATPGHQRELVKLGSPLNKGGAAGVVYSIQGDSARVVKLYNEQTLVQEGQNYQDKLEEMIGHPPQLPSITKPPGSPVRGSIVQIAWPLAIARDKKGRFVGFAMPAIEVDQTIELENVLLDKQAAAQGLKHDLGSKLLLAHNLASVVQGLHALGHAIVDLKPVNLRYYKQDLFMAVLDCDGFFINLPNRPLAAPQVTPDYLAPEFQSGGRIDNPQQQDRFALAVIIFKLLNFNTHPYQGVVNRAGLPETLEGKIAKGMYAYGARPHTDIHPAPGSAHESLPDELRTLFDKAFSKVAALRPSPLEWREALARYVHAGPEVCASGHTHFRGYPCGQCQREEARRALSTGSQAKTASAHVSASGGNNPKPAASAAKGGSSVSTHVQPPSSSPSPKTPSGGGFFKWVVYAMAAYGLYAWWFEDKPAAAVDPVAAVQPSPAGKVAQDSVPQPMAKRPYLGMSFGEGEADKRIYLATLDPNGPAVKAGLLAGDRLTMLNGRELVSAHDLKKAIEDSDPGKGYQLTVQREGRLATGNLVPEMLEEAEWTRRMEVLKNMPVAIVSIPGPKKDEAPSPPNLPKDSGSSEQPPLFPPSYKPEFGMRVNTIFVVSVTPNGPAARAGLQPGDMLITLNNQRVSSLRDVLAVINGLEIGDTIPLTYYRGGRTYETQIGPDEVDESVWKQRIQENSISPLL
jgi:membrane-associated protease RseP (regulator of RpoE activity)